MKIKLLRDIIVGKEHGMMRGRVFEVIEKLKVEGRERKPTYWVIGDTGKRVGIWRRECEVIDE